MSIFGKKPPKGPIVGVPTPSAARPPLFDTGEPVSDSADLQRILALPRRDVLDLESPRATAMVEHLTAKFARARTTPCECREIDPSRFLKGRNGCITRLLPIQAQMLHEIGLVNGLLGAVAVGAGKTIAGILAIFMLRAEDSSSGNRVVTGRCETALLLVPPSLIEQLWIDYRLLREHFEVPSLIVHGAPAEIPAQMIKGYPVLHVLAYSRLSLPTSSDLLRRIAPDAIICDEVDRMKDPGSAGTSRVLRRFGEKGDTRFCGWTGSLSDKSISEFAHLAALALRENSPLPLDPDAVKDWGRALDAVDNPAPPGALGQLCLPNEEVCTETAREGFYRRFSETPGIVVGGGDVVLAAGTNTEIELVLQTREPPRIPAEVEECLRSIRGFIRPDGEELIDALAMAKCALEAACGLYYRWVFPRGERKEVILEWLAARKDWNRSLRHKLLPREEWLDSPQLCEHAAGRAWGDRAPDPSRPDWKAEHWPRWRDIKDQVKPKTEAVRVHDFLARDAANWAHQHRGIVWYDIVEMGLWVSELAKLPMHAGGKDAGKRIRGEQGDRSIIASLDSHGRGRNGLQNIFAEQLIVNAPASATRWQQWAGRLYRRGQSSEQIASWVYLHTREVRKSFRQALRRASYVKGTQGQAQKISQAWRGELDEEE